jgi:capsid protein
MAKAHEIWCRLGVMTDAAIAEDLGHDIEDVYAQRAREKAPARNLRPSDHQYQGITNTADPLPTQDPSGDSSQP